MSLLRVSGIVVFSSTLLLAGGCGSPTPPGAQAQRVSSASLNLSGLETLPASHTYELWLKDGASRSSLGRFNTDNGENSFRTLQFSRTTVRPGMELELSIEPTTGDAPGQSEQRLLSGFMSDSWGAFMNLPRAMNFDPSLARIQFILETPSTASAEDYAQGLYWCVPGSFFGIPDPVVPLPQPDVVPVLPAGWTYEGWIVEGGGMPVSTGRFPMVMVPDSDANGPAAGPLPALPFPGQEYIDPPQTLPGKSLWLSIEPDPDYSPLPSGIILLWRDNIADAGPVTQQHMAAREGDLGPMPQVSVNFSN